jgi:hypothetical protein
MVPGRSDSPQTTKDREGSVPRRGMRRPAHRPGGTMGPCRRTRLLRKWAKGVQALDVQNPRMYWTERPDEDRLRRSPAWPERQAVMAHLRLADRGQGGQGLPEDRSTPWHLGRSSGHEARLRRCSCFVAGSQPGQTGQHMRHR